MKHKIFQILFTNLINLYQKGRKNKLQLENFFFRDGPFGRVEGAEFTDEVVAINGPMTAIDTRSGFSTEKI